ncbi:hypothetical protein HETIRDRAFT_449349 [Heterobasidion irregulare TC 32-1]|uniref:FAD/NAD(P)-binding domain-containing protein n=1 Tax=Heterobasidion irregulare (strain TC 32-1) TaxID=747525 RepID=W4KD23_HETIT|nr:uncharacterized protein HETIRDRAFT_449349 [Heterobasidion irregulare TC 32-1]ETW83688.1 hypothetical protein HETIRDRAFT_449349 [Heterobasidion irregulare TC 32-1]
MASLTDQKRKSVVVVGGGGAGSAVARQLSKKLDPARHSLTLITARPFYVHLPASLRMAVTAEGKLEDQILKPYDALVPARVGGVRVARVVGVEKAAAKDAEDASAPLGGWVLLQGGEKVWYDVLVVAPGMRWEGPLAYPDSGEEILAFIGQWRTKIEDAKEIVLAGGGPVNVELAGEIKEYWPEKKVHIVQSGDLPLNKVYPDHFRRRVQQEIEARGVNFRFDDRLDELAPVDGVVHTRKGKVIPADLVLSCRGGTPNTKFLESLGPDVLTEWGFVRVMPSLELQNQPGIFCAGDVLDNPERSKLRACWNHAAVIVRNVLDRLDGKPVLEAKYKCGREFIGISMGKSGGVSYVGILWGIILGNWITALFKSRTLGVRMLKYYF